MLTFLPASAFKNSGKSFGLNASFASIISSASGRAFKTAKQALSPSGPPIFSFNSGYCLALRAAFAIFSGVFMERVKAVVRGFGAGKSKSS